MALVIGADLTSRLCDPNDRKTYPLFGDGAGAVLLAKGTPQQGLLAYTLGADGSGLDLLCCPTGGSRRPLTHELLDQRQNYLRMEGRPVFKWAIRLLADTIKEVLNAANLTTADVDLFVLHQANVRILDAVADDLCLEREKMIINLDRFGNTSGASVPLALDEALERCLIRRGSNILLSGFGAGLAWGTALLRW
jgi:3-oxoacyl-[acyl-carrier-protein] synthase III